MGAMIISAALLYVIPELEVLPKIRRATKKIDDERRPVN